MKLLSAVGWYYPLENAFLSEEELAEHGIEPKFYRTDSSLALYTGYVTRKTNQSDDFLGPQEIPGTATIQPDLVFRVIKPVRVRLIATWRHNQSELTEARHVVFSIT